jgi:ABC-2 type transport system permease protein
MKPRTLSDLDLPAARVAPQPRLIGQVNWVGLWTMLAKEVRRFLKVYMQTILAPVVTTLLFYFVFALALGGGPAGAPRMVGDVPFLQFLAPGLVMMAMAQNAFANTSSSVTMAKVQGNIVDVLMPPLSAKELAFAWVMGGVVRGLAVGVATTLAIAALRPVHLVDPGAALLFSVLATVLLSLIGVIGGIWADKFDQIAAVTNFIITPLTFLSGTFYSVDRFPPFLRAVAHLNPFFYMIDGFRYGFIGHADSALWQGALGLSVLDFLLAVLLVRMLATGYKLKS